MQKAVMHYSCSTVVVEVLENTFKENHNYCLLVKPFCKLRITYKLVNLQCNSIDWFLYAQAFQSFLQEGNI